MTKITLNSIGDLTNTTTARTAINSNFNTIEEAFDNVLSRDGDSPNQMEAPIDMNSKRILNLPRPLTASEPLRYQELSDFVGGGTVSNLPSGGLMGDTLVKKSNSDYDTVWSGQSVSVVGGTNIVISGVSPVTVSTSLTPTFTNVTTPTLNLNGTALSAKTGTGSVVLNNSPVINTPTGIVKGDVGLGNVDNTSDATKNSAAVTLTNKTLTTPVLNGTVTGTSQATGNTASTLVMRDASGNFAAGTITAALSGNATTATSASTVTTNANLTGPITSVGNATSIASQTGTGTKFVVDSSPTLTGTPLTPTASVDTNTTQIASTAFVLAQAGSATPIIDGTAAVGTSTRFARQDHIHPTDTTRAALASPALTGTPTAPTAAVDTNTTQLATTAFVLAQAGSATPLIDGSATVGTSTRFARQDHIHPTDTTRAPLASPTLTGTPAAPTAAVDTNTTQVATTAFVLAQAASATPIIDGSATVGTSTRYARADHVHPTDTTRAPLVSPSFTTPSLGVATATSINGVSLDNTAWTNYTPTVTAGSGTITTLGTVNGYYKIIGKTLLVNVIVNVTTAGTAAADITISMPPSTVSRNDTAIPGKEFSVTGKTVNAYTLASGNTIGARYYDGTTVFANGIKVVISGIVEIQ